MPFKILPTEALFLLGAFAPVLAWEETWPSRVSLGRVVFAWRHLHRQIESRFSRDPASPAVQFPIDRSGLTVLAGLFTFRIRA